MGIWSTLFIGLFIFNPFFTKKNTGTGLGLAITAGIIDAHRGRIEARNRKKGGAEIVFTLPLKPQVSESEDVD